MCNNKEVNILVVDDDIDAAQSFADLIFNKLGMNVLAESRKDEVLRLVRQHPIKVVALDQRMPEISGTDLYKQIQNINPYIVALMVTGEASRQEVSNAVNLGFLECIEKNEINTLPSKIVKALSKYEANISKIQKTNYSLSNIWSIKSLYNRCFYQYSIVSIKRIKEDYCFPNKWKTQFDLTATEQEQEDNFEFESELIISTDIEMKTSSKSEMSLSQIMDFKSSLDTALTEHFSIQNRVKLNRKKRNKRVYKLQEGVEDGKKAVRKKFEYNQLYYHILLLVKRTCRICNNEIIIPVEVYKPIPYIQTKVTIFFTDSSHAEIDTGRVSLP